MIKFFYFTENDKFKIINIFGMRFSLRKKKLIDNAKIDYEHIINTAVGKMYDIINYNNISIFNNNIIRDNTVLIVEINPAHGELIPSFTKYCLDLGYNVDIFINSFLYFRRRIFDIIGKMNNVNIFFSSTENILQILKNKDLNGYKSIIFMSNFLYMEKYLIYDYIRKDINKKIIFVKHNFKYDDLSSIDNVKTIALNNIDCGLADAIVNPHYFGDIKITKKNTDIIKFIVIGKVENKRRNFYILFNAVKKLLNIGYKKFSIVIVGQIIDYSILNGIKDIDKYFVFKGDLSDIEMHKEIEEADFLLALLDPNNEDHIKYIKYKTSGVFQLSYGFHKLLLLEKTFSDKYGIDNDNGVLYEGNDDLYIAMKQAIDMTGEEYDRKQKKLIEYSNKIYELSKYNLNKILQDSYWSCKK